MKRKAWPLHLWFAIFGFVLFAAAVSILPFILTQQVELQTAFYSFMPASLAFLIAALVDRRIAALGKKLGIVHHGCPRGHVLPVDGCPFCRRDSRYL